MSKKCINQANKTKLSNWYLVCGESVNFANFATKFDFYLVKREIPPTAETGQLPGLEMDKMGERSKAKEIWVAKTAHVRCPPRSCKVSKAAACLHPPLVYAILCCGV